jgi:hypothetical protein
VFLILLALFIIGCVCRLYYVKNSKGYCYYQGRLYACNVEVDNFSNVPEDAIRVGYATYVDTEDPAELNEELQTTVEPCDTCRVFWSEAENAVYIMKRDGGFSPYLLFLPVE